MQKKHLTIWVTALATLFLLFSSTSAHAAAINTTFPVSFNTTSLEHQGVFDLVFLVTDGSGTNDGNTTVNLTNFQFGSGSGPASASVTDNAFFNEVISPFTPGNQLSFAVQLLSSSIDQPTPDLFEFVILGASGLPVQTTDPSGINSLITVNLTIPPNPQIFALSSVPEPGSTTLYACGLIILALVCRRRSGLRSTVTRSQ